MDAIISAVKTIVNFFHHVFTWIGDFFPNLLAFIMSGKIVQFFFDVCSQLVYFIVNALIKILVGCMDFIFTFLPDYDLVIPSDWMHNSALMNFLSWVFPVKTFCLVIGILCLCAPSAFLFRGFLSFIRILS